jgi:hypothetical protein
MTTRHPKEPSWPLALCKTVRAWPLDHSRWHPCTNMWRNTDKWARPMEENPGWFWRHIETETICRPGFMGRVHTYRGVPLKQDGPDPLRKGGASAVRAWGCSRCYVWASCSAGDTCR